MEKIAKEVVMEKIDIGTLKDMSAAGLNKIARGLKINGISSLRKQDLIFKILQAKAEKEGLRPEVYAFTRRELREWTRWPTTSSGRT